MKRTDQKNIDRQLRRMAEQTKPIIRQEYSNELDKLLDDLAGQRKEVCLEEGKKEAGEYAACGKLHGVHGFRGRYIVVVLAVALLLSVPVSAAVSYVSKRMKSVPEEEKEQFRDMMQKEAELAVAADNGDMEAITYSRQLSEEEEERYGVLFEAYEKEGRYPEKKLPIVEITEDTEGKTVQGAKKDSAPSAGTKVFPDNDVVYYISEKRCMYLPKRTLTDEEFLEIIDFYHILDYSLQNSDEADEYQRKLEEQKDKEPEAGSLSEAEAVVKAAEYGKVFFGISFDSMKTAVEYVPAELEGRDSEYEITFTQEDTCYAVSVDCVTGAFGSICKSEDGVDYYQENLAVNEDILKLRGADAKKLVQNILGEDVDIVDAYGQYKLNEEGLVPHGSAAFLFDLGNGDRVRLQYSIGTAELWCMFLENGAAGHRDRNTGKGEKRIFIELQE